MLEGKNRFIYCVQEILMLFLNIDRYTEIERENRILLEKMTNIMQHNRAMHTANSAI